MESTTANSGSDVASFGDGLRELASTMRALVADEADLVAAEAHLAIQSVVACVAMAVGAAVFAVLAIAGLFGLIAVKLVADGMSWPGALGLVSAACIVGCGLLVLGLKGMASRKFFAATRRELRGRH